MSFKILIADDRIDDAGDELFGLADMLRAAGYDVRTTPDPDLAYELIWEWNPDLIVLDIQFPDQPEYGIEICEAIRLNGNDVPIILVTAYMTETESVLQGFEAGADDYVTRPRDNREILARIRANLPPEVVVADDCILLDSAGRRVWVCRDRRWREVRLQRLQFELLELLILNTGQTVPTTMLKDRIWAKPVGDGALAVYIRRLRAQLETDPSHPIYIETVKGLGYRFNGRLKRASLAMLKQPCDCAEGDSIHERITV